jgi:antitoxin component YwqK of YwqJK toxin-antitoxin module
VKCPVGTTQKRVVTELLKMTTVWCVDAEGYRHGPEREWYANGQLGWEREYAHGDLHGPALGWYEDGSRDHQKAFRHGKLHGKAFRWHPNGRMAASSEWRDGKLLWMKWWDEKGRRLPPPPDFKLEP